MYFNLHQYYYELFFLGFICFFLWNLNDFIENCQAFLTNMGTSIENLVGLCRLCANYQEPMLPIYVNEGVEYNLETKIKTFLPFINVSINIIYYLPRNLFLNEFNNFSSMTKMIYILRIFALTVHLHFSSLMTFGKLVLLLMKNLIH